MCLSYDSDIWQRDDKRGTIGNIFWRNKRAGDYGENVNIATVSAIDLEDILVRERQYKAMCDEGGVVVVSPEQKKMFDEYFASIAPSAMAHPVLEVLEYETLLDNGMVVHHRLLSGGLPYLKRPWPYDR